MIIKLDQFVYSRSFSGFNFSEMLKSNTWISGAYKYLETLGAMCPKAPEKQKQVILKIQWI